MPTDNAPKAPSERIMAAAIRRDYVVYTGAHHHQIFRYLAAINADWKPAGCEQGFITSHNRFVDRIEGGRIAREAGQTLDDKTGGVLTLFSEMLWSVPDAPPPQVPGDVEALAGRIASALEKFSQRGRVATILRDEMERVERCADHDERMVLRCPSVDRDLATARERIAVLEREHRLCGQALPALQEALSTDNKENPWLGVCASVALLQGDLKEAEAEAAALRAELEARRTGTPKVRRMVLRLIRERDRLKAQLQEARGLLEEVTLLNSLPRLVAKVRTFLAAPSTPSAGQEKPHNCTDEAHTSKCADSGDMECHGECAEKPAEPPTEERHAFVACDYPEHRECAVRWRCHRPVQVGVPYCGKPASDPAHVAPEGRECGEQTPWRASRLSGPATCTKESGHPGAHSDGDGHIWIRRVLEVATDPRLEPPRMGCCCPKHGCFANATMGCGCDGPPIPHDPTNTQWGGGPVPPAPRPEAEPPLTQRELWMIRGWLYGVRKAAPPPEPPAAQEGEAK